VGTATKNLELLKAQHAAATQGKWKSAWEDQVDQHVDDENVVIYAPDAPKEQHMVVGLIYYDGNWAACTRPNAAAIATQHNAASLVHAIVEAALELEQANIDIDLSGRDPRGDVNSAYHREYAAKAALWAALEAFKEAEL
jgi:hypothetical protein